MKNLFYLAVVIVTAFFLSSCEKETTETVESLSQSTTSNNKAAGALPYYRKFQTVTTTITNENGEQIVFVEGYCVMIEKDCFPWDIVIKPSFKTSMLEVFKAIDSGNSERIKNSFTKHKEVLVIYVDEEFVNKVIVGDLIVEHIDGKDEKVDFMVFSDISGEVVFAYPMIL
ncbi:MAG: hypothetical protein RBR97_17080 [Bacteroidales bacterium]|jgi:hypothetical protein|nr:hypothetical protein [Bacteroidales bacterium]